jgi:hypothetical protein
MISYFQVEVVIQMKIVEVLTMDQQIEHVVALAQHLQTRLDPVQRCCLEEFGRLERPEQIAEKKTKQSALNYTKRNCTVASAASAVGASAHSKRTPSAVSGRTLAL